MGAMFVGMNTMNPAHHVAIRRTYGAPSEVTLTVGGTIPFSCYGVIATVFLSPARKGREYSIVCARDHR